MSNYFAYASNRTNEPVGLAMRSAVRRTLSVEPCQLICTEVCRCIVNNVCPKFPIETENLQGRATHLCTDICYVVDLIACARSTFGNDRILSSFFSFILTSNKILMTIRDGASIHHWYCSALIAIHLRVFEFFYLNLLHTQLHARACAHSVYTRMQAQKPHST
jgi:hypothetical protein